MSLLSACSSEFTNVEFEGYTDAPETITTAELSYEALPGSIRLNWNNADANYEYMKVSYVDPATNEVVTQLVSKYVNTLLVENTLQKYGDYEFLFQAFNAQNEPGSVTSFVARSGRAPATETVNKTKVTLTEDQLSTDNQEPSEGPIKNLIDGDVNTFFHTRWSSPQVDLPQYIQISFKEDHQNFVIYYQNRNGSQVGPENFDLLISQDGNDWETVKTVDSGLPSGSKAEYTSDLVRCDKPFRYFRFLVTKTFGDKKYFNLAEFAFYDAEILIDDPEAD